MAQTFPMNRPEKPWMRSYEEIMDAHGVEAGSGLGEQEVGRRRRRFGRNRLRHAKRKSIWAILVEQFKSLIVGLLVVAAIVSLAFGDIVEGIAIVAVIFINAALGFVMELRAVRSMEALRQLGTVDAKVPREGQVKVVPAGQVFYEVRPMVRGGD